MKFHSILVDILFTILYAGLVLNLSISHHFALINREPKIIDSLQKYILAEDTRLDKLQKFQNLLVENMGLYATEDELAWNPLGIYKTIKHLAVDWNEMKENMLENSYKGTVSKILEEENINFPDKEYLNNEILNLVELQKSHKLSIADMMDGHLAQNVLIKPALEAEDCFIIGKTCAEKYDYLSATEWLRGCEGRITEDDQIKASKILVTISGALSRSDKSLRMAVNNLLHKPPNYLDFLPFAYWDSEKQKDLWNMFKACRGSFDYKMAYRNLKCRYNHHNSPFLILAPLKEEMLSFAPKVSVFREALYDSEIELMKREADGLFDQAKVRHGDRRALGDGWQRSSQVAWLQNREPKYATLWNRLQDISTLSLTMSEMLQMLEYPAGGFYRVHNDFMTTCHRDRWCSYRGNRVGTALMYMNNVPMGGHTVFPRLKLSVKPVRGSILFWISMRGDASQEVWTRHSGCPVIYGTKEACTQWFRWNGQEYYIADPKDDEKTRGYSINSRKCQKRITV